MISTAIQRGTSIYVYNEKNSIIFVQSGTLMGYTSSSLSIKKGSTIYVYNDKGNIVSTH